MTGTTPVLDLDVLLHEEPFVRAIARGLLFDEHQVDDVVQQTWLQALRRPPAAGSARGWLARVVRSKASNLRRDEARRRQREDEVLTVLPSNDQIRAREASRRDVVEAVLALAEPYRGTVLLRYFEQLPPREIARRLGIPRATVATRLKRALKMLRDKLDRAHGGDRRAWCQALVPLALPREGAGMLTMNLLSTLGALWMMKHLYLLAVALVAILMLGAVLWFGPQADRPLHGGESSVVAMEGETNAEPSPSPSPSPREASGDREQVSAPPTDGGVPASVVQAMAGFRGRLVLPGGEPARGAIVRVLAVDATKAFGGEGDPFAVAPADAGPTSREARTDERGEFLVTGVWPGARCALHAGVGGPCSTLRVLGRTPGPAEVVDLGTITLDAKGTIEGTVVGPDGAPVVGAEVWSADLPGAILAMVPLDRFDDQAALFLQLPVVPPSMQPERDIGAWSGQLRSHLVRGIVDNRDGDDYAVLDLPPWARRFRDEWPVPRTVTAADGSFTLVGVDPGNNLLVVRKPGLASGGRKRVKVDAGETRDVGTLQLKTGDVVAGTVADASGAPVPHAEVRVALRPRLGLTGILVGSALYDADERGVFSVGGLPRGRVVVAYRREAGAPWAFATGIDAGDDDLQLQLDDGHDLEVELRTGSEAPLGGATVALVQGPPLGELSLAGLVRPLDAARHCTRVDDRHYRLHDLLPGVYTLHVEAEGHVPATRVVRVGDDAGRAPLELDLAPEADCRVQVVDSRGAPVAGARVFVQPADLPAWAQSVIYGNSDEGLVGWKPPSRAAGTTDARGELDLSGVPAGANVLTVRHPAFGPAAVRVSAPATARVVLPDCGTIRGTLYDHGEPASADRWRLVARRIGDAGPSGMPAPVGEASPAADGTFAIRGLPPGRYRLYVKPSLRDVQSLGALFEQLESTYTFQFASERSEDVEVLAGAEATVRLDVDESRGVPGTMTVRLTGRITIDGVPAAGYALQYGFGFSDPKTLCRTGPDGRFAADGLKAQTMRLLVSSDRGDLLWSQMLSIQGDRDVELPIVLRTGVVHGRVQAGDGTAAAGHEVSLVGTPLGPDGAPLKRASTHAAAVSGADGRFEVRLPAGTYTAQTVGSKGRAKLEGIEVAPGGSASCVLPLTADGVVAGRVLLPEPLPVDSWVWLTVRRTDVENAPWTAARLQRDGSFHLANVAPGRYELSIDGRDYPSRPTVPATLDVPSGGRLDLLLRPGAVREQDR